MDKANRSGWVGCFTELRSTQKSKGSTKLEKIGTLIYWNTLDYRIKNILNRSGLGPKGYEAMILFKALLLQFL